MRVSRAAGAAAVAVVLLTTACTSDTGSDETTGATDTAPTATSATTSTEAAAPGIPGTSAGEPAPDGVARAAAFDPAYAVERPGRRTEPVGVADILVAGNTTLSPELVERIKALEGVQATTTIALANVPLENKVYNVAAVDPREYRSFTTAESADLQAQWDRVAGGEAAVSPALQDRLPMDEDGLIRLGAGEGATLRVGAFAPQAEKVDLVVNRKRGEALGMEPDNALLISTGQTAPESLRRPLAALVGDSAVVQNLDAVARFGLDPGAFDSAVLVGELSDAVGVFNYTPTGGGRIAPDPAWVRTHISTEVVPILGSVTCNTFMMPQLKAALAEIVQLGLESKINVDEYAGCYYPRFIAGSTTLSNHSFGTALDFNVPGNLRGTVGEMDRGVVAVFKRWGFAWGGDWNYTDPMHFELARLVSPG